MGEVELKGFREAAFKMLRHDLDELDARHALGCHACSPKHACGYALGIAAAYRKIEDRLSPNRMEFPTIRQALKDTSNAE